MFAVYQVARWLRNSEGLWFGITAVTSSCSASTSFTLVQPVPQKVDAAEESTSRLLSADRAKLLAVSHSPKSLAEATASDAAKALKSYWLLSPTQAETASLAAPYVSMVSASSPSYSV